MKISASILLIFLLLSFSLLSFPTAQAQAKAAYLTSNDLLVLCKSAKKNDLVNCHGYMAGIIDYHNLVKTLGRAPSVDFCIPAQISIEQVTKTVLKYLAKSPQHDYFIAAPAVALALYKEFPCSS